MEDAHKGKNSVAADMPVGEVGMIRLDHGSKEVDLSKFYALSFWWKAEGEGLKSFMVKIRNYPLVDGMEAVYPIWNSGKENYPTDWQRAFIVLSDPYYDNWGGKPDRKSKYMAFRTQTSDKSHVRLFLDEVIALPPIFDWKVSSPVLEADKISIIARNLTNNQLSINFGSGDQLLKQIDVPAKREMDFQLTLKQAASKFSQIEPFQNVPVQIWAEAANLEETRMDRTINAIKKGDLPQHPRLLFSGEGIEKLKERIEKYDWAEARWAGVKRNADRMLDEEIELPPRGGNWWHWYACPEHGAALRTGKQLSDWQWEHYCTVDSKVYRSNPDEPRYDYDGCVISGSHSRLARAVLDLGIVYQVTGDSRYAEKAREILIAYADRYLDYPLHTTRGEERIGGGRVGPQTLDEAVWLIPVCQGMDLIWDKLSQEDRSVIAQKMLLPAAKDVILPHRMGVHNIQCWKNSAVGLVGFLLGDDELIGEAIYNPDRGYWKQMDGGVLPDGIWWEGAWGYHFYTLSSLWSLTEAAHNCGVNLYCEEFRLLFDGPLKFAMPDLKLPAFNDSGEVALKGGASIYELAYARYGDPDYTNLIRTGDRRNDFALRFGVGELPPETPTQWKSINYPDSGYAILAGGEGEKAKWLCMKYGPHGGGHGHPDKLNFVLYSDGQIIAPDPGTARYGVPIQGGWYRTTLAHNTLVVNEASQKSAEGRCLAFGSKDGVDYVVAVAGNIYDGVRFTRTTALIENSMVLFIDQVNCESERLLDVVYHNRGTWDSLPDGAEWIPPDTPGYSYLRDATAREISDGIDMFIDAGDGARRSISLAASEPTLVITATGLEKHAEDRVPMVIFRRKAKETAFVWCVGLNGQKIELELLPVPDPATAVSVQVGTDDGQRRTITINTKLQDDEVFDVK